jgi:hypothetical protein
MNNILTELQAALRAAGHGADEVQNSPVDLLNVWLNDEGRIPVATVMYTGTDDGGFFVWGPKWEHTTPTSAPMPDIVRQITEAGAA